MAGAHSYMWLVGIILGKALLYSTCNLDIPSPAPDNPGVASILGLSPALLITNSFPSGSGNMIPALSESLMGCQEGKGGAKLCDLVS